MFNQSLIGMSVFAFVIPFASQPSQALAQIPMLWGSGEALSEVGELPDNVAAPVNEEFGANVSVGFLYQRFHIFWCDLWTWNGRHVLYEGDKYWELESDQWNRLLGRQPMAAYGKPMCYRFPPGLIILLCLCVVLFVGKRLCKTDRDKVKELLKDRHYQVATEMLVDPSQADESKPAHVSVEDERFREAVNFLVKQGISPFEAETNLKMLAEVIAEGQEEQLDQQFELASQLDQEGEWDKSIEVYTGLLEQLPETDDRRKYAENCIASVKQKQNAIDT